VPGLGDAVVGVVVIVVRGFVPAEVVTPEPPPPRVGLAVVVGVEVSDGVSSVLVGG
jgi:cytochrome oxidase assembly protein ShyY1